MKRTIAILVSLMVLSMTAVPAAAQTRNRRAYHRSTQSSRYDDRYDNRRYDANRAARYRNRNDNYRYRENRSVWDRHRDKITTAAGAGGGAVLGALIGGKKGAIIGAIAGGAGAALYTYKIRDKRRRF